MPSVQQALHRLEREVTVARQDRVDLLKIVHGYGSTGAGGDIRIAVQKRLTELTDAGQIRGRIFGENWGTSDADTWRLLQQRADLKKDPDLGRQNRGITVVLL